MAVDAAGNLYVAEQNGGSISGSGGLNTSILDYPPPFNSDPMSAFLQNTPSDLAFDQNGNLFAYFGRAWNGSVAVNGVIMEFGASGGNSVVATDIPGTSANTGYLAVAVPEPSAYGLLAIGFVGVLALVRRKALFG